MPYVYSTLSADMKFGDVIISGGAGVAHKRTLIMPDGVATNVTADQLVSLESHRVFAEMKNAGYFTTSTLEKNADKVAQDMKAPDGGKQSTDKTLKTAAKVKKD